MSTPSRFGAAVSLIAVTAMIAGCSAPQGRVSAASNFGGKLDENVGLATRALAALNSNNFPVAVDFAERAVAATPSDAGFRALLGNAYFANGRFWSAEAAYKNALPIYSNQPKVALKLALVEVALGKKDEAIAFLEAGRDIFDPADYGLALALAGRSAEAVSVLEVAARQSGSDARPRQNLALAYALAGDWTQARTVAAQDVPANQLDARIQQWMQLANPRQPSDQVATLLGVTPARKDQGQPIRLALHKSEQRLAAVAPVNAPIRASERVMAQPQPQPRVAEAPVPLASLPDTIPLPQFVESAPVPAPQFIEAAVVPAPVVAIAPAPPPPRATEASSPAPLTTALIAAASRVRSAFSAFIPRSAPAARPTPHKVARTQSVRGTTGAVVQLGAYGSAEGVTAAWSTLTDRYPALRAYLPMRARFVSPKGTFWRLSITGFASQREAQVRCEVLRGRGGNCFVRNFAGDVPVQYASR